jgi:hypothetical protein
MEGAMIVNEVGRIEPGKDYRRHEQRIVADQGGHRVEDVELLTYRVEGFARDGRTFVWVVVYRGLEGADAGQLFVCSLYDFALRFRPLAAPEPQPPAPTPERSVGHISQGANS